MKNKIINLINGLQSWSEDHKEKLIEFLNKTDYFTAPASARFHNSFEGGLAAHSYNVYEELLNLKEKNGLNLTAEDCVVIGLLHDICKVDFYSVEMRNAKNAEIGKWEKVPYYQIDEWLPIGVHGDKSLIIALMLTLPLTEKQGFCIRYHMGAYEGKEAFNALHTATAKYREILWVQLADQLATSKEEEKMKNGD